MVNGMVSVIQFSLSTALKLALAELKYAAF
jgi:hypothetical protein